METNNTDLVDEKVKKAKIKEAAKKEKEELKAEVKKEREEFKKDIESGKQEIRNVIETTIDPNGDKVISAGEIFGEMFSITKDVASREQIRENLISGGHVTGTNMCLLVLAILIASIGLNVNSTAVIIGAMLISPLMGTIQATAYGTATSDFPLIVRSIMGFLTQVFISLCTSTLYFLISPLSDTTSELLARTQPTIWDVMIAICGGLAGIIGVTRKEKTNVIPGVAIATALMPPLCTCGYSIAHGQWRMLLGAGYLFAANSYFIFLSAAIILMVLGIPKVKIVDKRRSRRFRNAMIRNTILMIIPSIIFAYAMLHEASSEEGSVIGFETAIDVVSLSEEMNILFPSVTDISVGTVSELDDDNQQIERKVILVNIDNNDNEENEEKEIEETKDLISKWLGERYEGYEVSFQ